jgi:hypothetical protein
MARPILCINDDYLSCFRLGRLPYNLLVNLQIIFVIITGINGFRGVSKLQNRDFSGVFYIPQVQWVTSKTWRMKLITFP